MLLAPVNGQAMAQRTISKPPANEAPSAPSAAANVLNILGKL